MTKKPIDPDWPSANVFIDAPGMRVKIVGTTFVDRGIEIDRVSKFSGEDLIFDNVPIPFQTRNVGQGSIVNTRIKNDPKTRKAFTGWRRQDGPALPSYCEKCKHVFASRNYFLAGQFFNLWGNDDTCINCGFDKAKLSEGHFSLVGDTVKILRAPEITKEMVERLVQLGKDVASGKLTSDEAATAAAAIHPNFGFIGRLLLGAYVLYASVVGTVSASWDLYERTQGGDTPQIAQKLVEQILVEHDRLWREKLQSPQGNIFDNDPMTNLDSKATATPTEQKSVEKDSAAPAKSAKARKKSRKQNRIGFGRSRTH